MERLKLSSYIKMSGRMWLKDAAVWVNEVTSAGLQNEAVWNKLKT
jgi:hypothetical protein